MSKNGKAAKTAYAQPKLAVYGAFSQITASGSAGSSENSAMTGDNLALFMA